ncbi:lytic transglycosylase domain-containing protein [Rhizobium sp. L1K21]|uniref:lytic transglycosylase domain-containing protein n=1 Tax=Rhizobium sp. L1K21 TaxID=2954933 RepID=UPI0020939ABF|nr:lytic transglycosylase domain-containing protein [Rhizobium sp. L1K21]MCO6185626.1 lytic transglycosylase domain-containing protein [Rhizobium sp. L1K21]
MAQLNKVGVAALSISCGLALSACTSTELASLDKNGTGAAKTAEAAEVDLSTGQPLPASEQKVAEATDVAATAPAAATSPADVSASSSVTAFTTTGAVNPALSAATAAATDASATTQLTSTADPNTVESTPLALVDPSNIKDMTAFFPPAPGKRFAAVTIKTRSETPPPEIEALIKKYSRIYGVPEDLVHHVAHRESTYNPAALHKGNYGLMQIRYNTAKGLGYQGKPSGLLDAETNLKYAVKYLHNAWIVADKDKKAADWLYRTGYYYQAKSKGKLGELELLNSDGLH